MLFQYIKTRRVQEFALKVWILKPVQLATPADKVACC
jgi:hypothetical protein